MNEWATWVVSKGDKRAKGERFRRGIQFVVLFSQSYRRQRAGGVVQVVEHLLSKHKASSSNPRYRSWILQTTTELFQNIGSRFWNGTLKE
jgi:hypothetical protein